MPSYSGVWNLASQYQAVGAGLWPPNYVAPTGLFGGGQTTGSSASATNVIATVSLASTGNAIDFGDLSSDLMMSSACSSSTRAVVGGGKSTTSDANATNAIQYVTINTLGNTTSFGDLTIARSRLSSCSNGHGGL